MSQLYPNSTTPNSGTVKIQWLDEKPAYSPGTTFGVPWPRGKYQANDTIFSVVSNGDHVATESWITGYWSDSSVKWTAHAIAASALENDYTVNAVSKNSTAVPSATSSLEVTDSFDTIKVDTGKITATFSKTGNILVQELKTSSGQVVGQNGKLILRSQSSVFDDEDKQGQPAIQYFNFESKIDNVTVSKNNIARTLVTVHGDHRQINGGNSTTSTHKDWLPFVVRFYFYADSESIRIVHSLIYDGVPETDFVRGIGLRFDVPLADEFYDRHIRIAGVDGGILNEAVQGITGLRRDPGQAFLRTGQADLYRFAEAHTRHTGESDVYHLGPWKGLGTRHGVNHWSDSSKQIRISQPQYRKVFYYLTGGDERVGDLLTEILDAEKAFLVVDPRRKVRAANITYIADPEALLIDVGLDWSGQAAAWLIEYERRGPRWQEARSKLLETMKGIANLKNGFVTGEALYNLYNGTIVPPSQDPDNKGVVGVSHLTAVFGLVEVIAELTTHFGDDFPADFENGLGSM
ncbi:hypothetical protein D6C83_08284 [Aureobasidium pullulans]|uniref:Uncharacterized protein n=1 Tax=Aureobasidium pullulans TaxID=5580 RepID=A0A4T0A851_AURPU|nr:hypothetical protein D6C83_08284 [Aureobasidium pullulans]